MGDATAQDRGAAQRAKDLLRNLLDASQDGLVLLDEEHRLIVANEAFKRQIVGVGDLIKPGVSYRDILFALSQRNQIQGENASWAERRWADHLACPEVWEVRLSSGPWLRVREAKTPDGGWLITQTDITVQKKAALALVESEERYRKLVNLAPDLICVLIEGRISFINHNGAAMLGFTERKPMGRAFTDFVPPPMAENFTSALAARHEEGEWRPLKIVAQDGKALDVSMAFLPFRQADVEAMMVVARDVTEQKRSTAALVGRDERLRGIMDTVDDGILTIDETGRVESFNPAAERIFGYSAREIIGVNVGLLMPEAVATSHDGYLEAYRRNGKERKIGFGREEFGRRKDGTLIPIELSIAKVELSDKRIFAGVVRDISDRKSSERALKESEQRFALAIDGADEGIWDWDILKSQVYASPRAAQLVGVDAATLRDPEAWVRHIHPDDQGMFRRALLDHLRGRTEFFICEYRLHPDTGSRAERWIRQRGMALRNGQGRSIRMAGSVDDITRQRRTEETLRRAKEQAEVANRAKTEFLANMSHELRTPLNAVIGFSEVLQSQMLGPLGTSKYVEYAQNITDSGRHLLDIINDILDVSRIEAGEMEIFPEPLDMPMIAAAAERLISQRARAAGVSLVVEVGDDLPPRLGETRRMKQILINLLSNAVKFTPEGGVVTLRGVKAEDGGLIVTVADTGLGMRKEDIPEALRPFGQIDSSLSRKYEGTGLGLPLTKAFVELHGGWMDMDSELGVGTTVTLTFPPFCEMPG